MLDKITNPEKFIDAEEKGADWIKAQKKEYSGFGEIVKSFFGLKSPDHDPFANAVFKYGGAFVGADSLYMSQFLERSDRPFLVGGILLTWGIAGTLTAIMGTRDSMKRRGIERKRKLQRAVS